MCLLFFKIYQRGLLHILPAGNAHSHFASIFFACLWSFRWPNYIVTLPRYFSFRLPHLNIPSSDELDKNIQQTSLRLLFSHWNGYSHFRSGLNWFRKFKKRCFKNQMSVIWSWAYFYNLHWNNYLYFKGLLYIWEEMIMMALLHMAGLENSECIWKIQRKPEVAVSVQWLKNRRSDVRWIFLSNSSEGGPACIFKCGSRKEKYLGSVTL
jgi:hypothetical protein